MSIDLKKIVEDRDVVEPFIQRLMQRLQERLPRENIRLEDISLTIEVRVLNGPARLLRMLDDMLKEGVVL